MPAMCYLSLVVMNSGHIACVLPYAIQEEEYAPTQDVVPDVDEIKRTNVRNMLGVNSLSFVLVATELSL